MPDFAMCSAEYVVNNTVHKCPYANFCYRHTAEPTAMQSYMHPPYDPKSLIGCQFFMKPYATTDNDRNSIISTIFAMYLKFMISTVASAADFKNSKRTLRLQITNIGHYKWF